MSFCLFAIDIPIGHIISHNGIQPDPDKVSAVRDFPIPRKVRRT